MPLIKVTKAEINKFKTIPPGFYPAIATEFDEKGKPSATPGSNAVVYKTTFKVLDNQFLGTQITEYFNTSGGFRIVEFASAAEKVKTEEFFPEGKEEVEFDIVEVISKSLNKVVGIKVTNEPYQGNLTNKIQNFQIWQDEVPFG